MTFALYGTIWTALALFAAAEMGRRRFSHGGNPAVWARQALLLGAALMVAHVLIALATRYGWNHEAAVQETARQAGSVYGFEWRGNIYVSYAFVLLWFVEVLRWPNAGHPAAPPGLAVWVLRAFFLMIIFNGAVVFATTPWTRTLGGALVATLVWAWWPDRSVRAPAHG